MSTAAMYVHLSEPVLQLADAATACACHPRHSAGAGGWCAQQDAAGLQPLCRWTSGQRHTVVFLDPQVACAGQLSDSHQGFGCSLGRLVWALMQDHHAAASGYTFAILLHMVGFTFGNARWRQSFTGGLAAVLCTHTAPVCMQGRSRQPVPGGAHESSI